MIGYSRTFYVFENTTDELVDREQFVEYYYRTEITLQRDFEVDPSDVETFTV